eukprot:s5948_g10.t1
MLGGEGCNAWEVNTIDLKSALTLHPMETLSLKASRVFSPHSCRFLDSQEQLLIDRCPEYPEFCLSLAGSLARKSNWGTP